MEPSCGNGAFRFPGPSMGIEPLDSIRTGGKLDVYSRLFDARIVCTRGITARVGGMDDIRLVIVNALCPESIPTHQRVFRNHADQR